MGNNVPLDRVERNARPGQRRLLAVRLGAWESTRERLPELEGLELAGEYAFQRPRTSVRLRGIAAA